MLNAFKCFVGSNQHDYSLIIYKLNCIVVKQAKFQIYISRKNHLCYQKSNKNYI